jgi:hypothetical protein
MGCASTFYACRPGLSETLPLMACRPNPSFVRMPRHSVRDCCKFLERRIRPSELGKDIQGLLGKTGPRLFSPVDAGRRQALPLLFAFLKPFGGVRRIGAAEDFITLGERIVAIKILFAGLDHVEQMHRGLLAKRCPGVVSRPILKIRQGRNTTSSSLAKNLSWAAEIESN